MTADAGIPEQCEVADCSAEVATWCPLCERFLCLEHDPLPGGHTCLREAAD